MAIKHCRNKQHLADSIQLGRVEMLTAIEKCETREEMEKQASRIFDVLGLAVKFPCSE